MRSVPLTAAPAPAVRAVARVVANSQEGGANHRLRLRVPGWPGARPGQFVMLSPGPLSRVRRDDPLLPRPMAVYREIEDPGATADGGPDVEILYKVEGRGTALLAEADAGDEVRVVGPLGRPFPLPEPGAAGRCLVVAGGTGVASVYGLAATAAGRTAVSVLLGARSAEDLMARDDFEALVAGGADLDLQLTTEDGSLGERGLVTAPLERALAGGGGAAGQVGTVYCCGPTPMMRACAERCAAAGVRCVVSLENNMACGFGVCLGCAAPRPAGDYALVCRDGPVFDASEIAWDGLP